MIFCEPAAKLTEPFSSLEKLKSNQTYDVSNLTSKTKHRIANNCLSTTIRQKNFHNHLSPTRNLKLASHAFSQMQNFSFSINITHHLIPPLMLTCTSNNLLLEDRFIYCDIASNITDRKLICI